MVKTPKTHTARQLLADYTISLASWTKTLFHITEISLDLNSYRPVRRTRLYKTRHRATAIRRQYFVSSGCVRSCWCKRFRWLSTGIYDVAYVRNPPFSSLCPRSPVNKYKLFIHYQLPLCSVIITVPFMSLLHRFRMSSIHLRPGRPGCRRPSTIYCIRVSK